jgi:hypothetical protein
MKNQSRPSERLVDALRTLGTWLIRPNWLLLALPASIVLASMCNAAPPVITSPTNAYGIVGESFLYTITASNNPTSFTARNLPLGLTINTNTGIISGVPLTITNRACILSASNADGRGAAAVWFTIMGIPVASTPFVPSLDGFPFMNWGSAWVDLGELPGVGRVSFMQTAHCYGMALAALDYFAYGIPPDLDVIDVPSTDSNSPPPLASTSLTYQWINKRHGDQMGFNAFQFYPNWLKWVTGIDVPDGLGRQIMEHGFHLLRTNLLAGKAWPIALLGPNPGVPGIFGHAAVVYRITRDLEGHYLLSLYDPNYPGDDSRTAMVFTPGSAGSPDSSIWSFRYMVGNDADGHALIADFFWPVEDYAP